MEINTNDLQNKLNNLEIKKQSKIILSKKGLDSSFCNQLILFDRDSDKELTFMPILDKQAPDQHTYKNFFNNINVQQEHFKPNAKIMWNYNKTGFKQYDNVEVNNFKCHIDPQLKNYFGNEFDRNFRASFGQRGKAQGYLTNCEISAGDVILFYGLYYNKKLNQEQNIIFGYMEIGDILTFDEKKQVYRTKQLNKNKVGYEIIGKFQNGEFIKEKKETENIEEIYPFLNNQPHWIRFKKKLQNNYKSDEIYNDAIYIAKENKFGTFSYKKSLILTKIEDNKLKTKWFIKKLEDVKVLYPMNRKVFLKSGEGRLVKGYCQELVFKDKEVTLWAEEIIK